MTHNDYREIFHIVKGYFNVIPDKENEDETIAAISQGITFHGANLWVLIFAIFMASLGLNVNSTAVIIGAMLISPLMGPIIGMGLAVGIDDLDLMRRSFTNFVITTVISVVTASLYFLLTPITEAQSELLARTSPTLYDVLIALCGGAAGIVALATKGKGNVIPGVAIATALMPPLCTAGYGIATGQLTYFLGAFYLYFINTVFICAATFIGVRMMKFRHRRFANRQALMHVRKWILAIVVLTMVPATWMTIGIIRQSMFKNYVDSFVRNELNFRGTQIISHTVDPQKHTLNVVSVGQEITKAAQLAAERKLSDYRLDSFKLQIIQGVQSDSLLLEDGEMHSLVAADSKTGRRLLNQAQRIRNLERQLDSYRRYELLGTQLASEMKALFPGVTAVTMATATENMTDSLNSHNVVLTVVKMAPDTRLTPEARQRMQQWLTSRSKAERLQLVITN